ncbi:hypothetical protein SVIOM342S_09887 [Streptomyces violaceorubidus]
MIRTKTKRLSTLSDFSVMKPAKAAGGFTAADAEQAEPEEARQGDPGAGPDTGFQGRYDVRTAASRPVMV